MPGMRSLPLPAVLEVLEKMSSKFAALAAIGVTTGCRITEILSLKRSDLVSDTGEIKERVKFIKLKTKNEKAARTLLIPEDFQIYIIRHLQEEAVRGYELKSDWVFRGSCGGHLKRQAVYNTFRRVLGKGYGTHWMRKTFAQELYKFFLNENPNDSLRALDLTRQCFRVLCRRQ